MKPAWRGVVMDDGSIWAWPTVLWDHNDAFAQLSVLREYRCRQRQWSSGGPIDFDSGSLASDKQRVQQWVDVASA